MKKTSKQFLKNLNEVDHQEALVIELDKSNKYTKKHKDESSLKEKIKTCYFSFLFFIF